MYLREMGTVPLLTREGEVEIAKRIERGQLHVLKALSRSPIVTQEMFALREALGSGSRSIKEVVVFNDDELTEDKVAERLADTIAAVDEIERLNKKLGQLMAKRDSIPRSKRPRDFRRYSMAVARHHIIISQLIRSVEFTHLERKRLIEKTRNLVETVRPLERDASRLEKRLEGARGDAAQRSGGRRTLSSCLHGFQPYVLRSSNRRRNQGRHKPTGSPPTQVVRGPHVVQPVP